MPPFHCEQGTVFPTIAMSHAWLTCFSLESCPALFQLILAISTEGRCQCPSAGLCSLPSGRSFVNHQLLSTLEWQADWYPRSELS